MVGRTTAGRSPLNSRGYAARRTPGQPGTTKDGTPKGVPYHIVFRAHANRPVIAEEHERELYMYILGFCRNHQCVLYRIGGMPDHVHLCVGLHPTIAVASFVHDLKIATGNFMRSRRDLFPMFERWESSYGAFTYAEADKERFIGYIKNQKEHHKRVNTHDEMVTILKEFGIEYDERYV